MQPLRRLLFAYRPLAMLAVAAALLLRLLAPAGFMPVRGDGGISLAICSGSATIPAEVAMDHASGGHAADRHGDPVSGAGPCAFAALALPILGGGDPVPAAVAIAFVVALALVRRTSVRFGLAPHPRPPSHGPPALR